MFGVQQLEARVRANNELLPDISMPRGFHIKFMYVPVHESVLLFILNPFLLPWWLLLLSFVFQ